MKKLIIITALLCCGTDLKAQILTPVHWSYGFKRTSKTEAVILIKATIDEGWHIYSQNMKDGGPVQTKFTFNAAKGYVLLGKTTEPKPVTNFEKAFDMNVSYFTNSVIFQQRIKLNTGQVSVKGVLEYMCCNDKQCLPPEDVDFTIAIK